MYRGVVWLYYFIILPLQRVGRAIDDYGIIVQDPRVLAYLNTFKGGPSFPLPSRDWGSSPKERRNAGVEAPCMDLSNSSRAFFFLFVLTLYLRVKYSFFFFFLNGMRLIDKYHRELQFVSSLFNLSLL